MVKVDGTGRLTIRNRRFLKKLFQDKSMFHYPIRPQAPSTPLNPTSEIINSSPLIPQNEERRESAPSPPVTDANMPIPEDIPSTPEETPLQFQQPQPELHQWNPDRPARARKERKMYDASSGKYKDRIVP